MDEEFIESVRGIEELYNKGHRLYMDTKRKEKIWKELSKKHGVNGKYLVLFHYRQ